MNRILLFLLLLIVSNLIVAQNLYPEISLPELMKKKQADRNIVILDVRTDGEYYDTAARGPQSNIGRIRDSKHIELQRLLRDSTAIDELRIYKDKEIYVVCSHSYRSRRVSNLLKSKGFEKVTNVRGGMTEWFRRYEDLVPYRQENYETSVPYRNISSAELYELLLADKKQIIIGISNTPRFFYDSMNITFYKYYPAFKNASYYAYTDSLKILEALKLNPGFPVVLFNLVNNGAAELAAWLKSKGINAAYLVGGSYYFYDYVLNTHKKLQAGNFMVNRSKVNFISVSNFCTEFFQRKNAVTIDLRPDSTYNSLSDGMKNAYTRVRGSANFDQALGYHEFISRYTDKSKDYILISDMGITGIELADQLAREGYRIHWLNGGIHQVDWYRTNMENSPCLVLE